jgi:hypothetical protein
MVHYLGVVVHVDIPFRLTLRMRTHSVINGDLAEAHAFLLHVIQLIHSKVSYPNASFFSGEPSGLNYMGLACEYLGEAELKI